MTKSDFLERLAAELKRHHVSEPDEIIDEYREHFAFKLADGYSEEEIATKLGAPGAIAAQYVAAPAEGGRGKKAITAIGLGAVDFCFGLLCVLLYAWEIVMGALVLALGALSVVLMGNLTGEIGWARRARHAISLRPADGGCGGGVDRSCRRGRGLLFSVHPPADALLRPVPCQYARFRRGQSSPAARHGISAVYSRAPARAAQGDNDSRDGLCRLLRDRVCRLRHFRGAC